MTKILNYKHARLGHLKLELGIYLGFAIWRLGFK
jgi:hypothetical protein